MSSFAVGGNIDDEADVIEPRFVPLVVFLAAATIVGALIFLGSAYLNEVSYAISSDSFTATNGSATPVIMGMVLVTVSMVLMPLSIMYATGEFAWREVPKAIGLGLPFGLLFALITMMILFPTQPSVSTWVQDRYQVQSVTLPEQSGPVYALNDAGDKLTFQYTRLDNGYTLKHMAG